MLDLIIRNGTVVDGTGGEPFGADVAIAAGRIAAVGKVTGRGAEEIDARGLLVTPGFVDPHTHYDGQATWSSRITPSSWNGVTTTLFGNCGVGFAPCKPSQREMLVKLMEGVEDIPEVVLTEGLPWNWQSFPDFLDALAARQYDMDIATQVPHAALRVFVMGERGADREPATEQDRAEMARLVAEGIKAGALGFSTSRTLNHKTLDGRSIPTLTCGRGGACCHRRRAAATSAWGGCRSSRTSTTWPASLPCCDAWSPGRGGRWRSRSCSATASRRNGGA